jgi:phage shock protein PspC (stress-responsive transcriptional regulator)
MAKTEPTQQKSELSQWDERIALIARVIAALAGSVALIYAVGFAIINLSLLKYGVFEVGVVRERFLQAGAIYLLVLVLLASMALATAYASGKVVEHRLWPALLLCLLPILAISFVLTGLAYNFEFDASVIEMWTVPAWYVGTGFVILAIILGWLYVGRLLTEDKSETTRLLKRLAGWGILLSAMIRLLFI